MNLPPLNERDAAILEEKKRLEDVYKKCAEIFGSPNISPEGARALDRINEAIQAIGVELKNRSNG